MQVTKHGICLGLSMSNDLLLPRLSTQHVLRFVPSNTRYSACLTICSFQSSVLSMSYDLFLPTLSTQHVFRFVPSNTDIIRLRTTDSKSGATSPESRQYRANIFIFYQNFMLNVIETIVIILYTRILFDILRDEGTI